MNDAAYVINLENCIAQYLKPCQQIPLKLVLQSFEIEVPKSIQAKEITLKEYLGRSIKEI